MLEYPIDELSNMTMGIIGYGELGENVAKMAKHFGFGIEYDGRRYLLPIDHKANEWSNV